MQMYKKKVKRNLQNASKMATVRVVESEEFLKINAHEFQNMVHAVHWFW